MRRRCSGEPLYSNKKGSDRHRNGTKIDIVIMIVITETVTRIRLREEGERTRDRNDDDDYYKNRDYERFFLGSNKVMQVSLGRSISDDEIKPGLHKISKVVYDHTYTVMREFLCLL